MQCDVDLFFLFPFFFFTILKKIDLSPEQRREGPSELLQREISCRVCGVIPGLRWPFKEGERGWCIGSDVTGRRNAIGGAKVHRRAEISFTSSLPGQVTTA